MCKICDKNLYFEGSWQTHDLGGYGEDEYGGKVKNMIFPIIICPACGKLKTEVAIKKFGSVENALAFLMMQNLPKNITKSELISKVRDVYDGMNEERMHKILEQNDLEFAEGSLTHKCGHTLLKRVKLDITDSKIGKLESILTEKNMKFCPNCGKKILPFNGELNIISDDEIHTFEGEKIKTWDRGNPDFVPEHFKD